MRAHPTLPASSGQQELENSRVPERRSQGAAAIFHLQSGGKGTRTLASISGLNRPAAQDHENSQARPRRLDALALVTTYDRLQQGQGLVVLGFVSVV